MFATTRKKATLAVRRARPAALLPFALAAACTGSIGGAGADGVGGPGDPPVGPDKPIVTPKDGAALPEFTCDGKAVGAAQQFRRLTTAQYRNTLHDLFTQVLASSAAAAQVMTSLNPVLAKLPEDARKAVKTASYASFTRFSQDASQELIDSSYDVAIAAGAALTQPARLGTVVGTCATDGQAANDAACLGDFIDRFGALALRRPVAAAEKDFFRVDVYGADSKADAAAYADLIAVLLLAPQFLLHVEHGAGAVAGLSNTFALSPYELASRLSYTYWDTMPDKELQAAAASGELGTAAGLTQQVDRLMADSRAHAAWSTFFREWLRRDAIDDLTFSKDDKRFQAFAAANMPTTMLRQSMIDEVVAMTDHYVFGSPGSLPELLTSDLMFARGQDLAGIYGLPAWDGQGNPPTFSPGQRPGLLTRAAFHAFRNPQTRPVQKGVFIRDAILCDELPQPPPSVNSSEPKISPTLSTRQVLEELTEQEGTICNGCHASAINPIGFATEGYDSLGRLRSEQVLFDDTGKEIARAPIDTHAVPQIVYDDLTTVDGPAGLMDQIVKSGKAEACLARQVFRFAFVTSEDIDRDGCALQQIHATVKDGGAMSRMLREVALVPGFSQRVIP